MTLTLHEKPAGTSKSQFVKLLSFMVSLGRGGGGKGGGRSSAWTRRRVNWVSSCCLPALLARLQPVTSLSFVLHGCPRKARRGSSSDGKEACRYVMKGRIVG